MPVEPERAADGIFAPGRRRLTAGILLAIGVFAVEGMGVVPALPLAMRELGALGAFAWSFSAFMLAWLVGTVAAGLLADARGPRLPMATGLVMFGAGLLAASAAPHVAPFLAGRALQGAGGGGMMAAAYVAVARGYPDALRARMMAVTASVWILPAAVGPVLSGAVAEWVGWRFVFLGVVPLVALAALVVLAPLAALDTRRQNDGGARLISALRVALGAATILGAAGLFETHLALGLAVLAPGLWLFVPALGTLLPRGTFLARRGLPAGMAARALLSFSFFGTEALVPLVTMELRGATATRAGLALTAGAAGWISASWALDRLEARVGAARRVRAVGGGFALVAAGTALVAGVLLSSLPLWLLLVGWSVAGAGIGLAYSAGTLLCFAAAPPGREGEVSGQLQVAEALSNAAGTGLGGALATGLLSVGASAEQAYGAVFALTVSAGAAGVALAPRLGVTAARPDG
ncbi:MAG: MFS transporter [Polyangiaceae bacterium]|nr:MFS transporter [Polyangiaceae bacterium]